MHPPLDIGLNAHNPQHTMVEPGAELAVLLLAIMCPYEHTHPAHRD